MSPPSQGSEALPAKVRFQVESEFEIDVLDYVPLAERRKAAQTGEPLWDPNVAVKRVSPGMLTDIFVRDLVHALRPVGSFFSEEQKVCHKNRDNQMFHDKKYTTTVPDGRIVEVLIKATAVECGCNSPTAQPTGFESRTENSAFFSSLNFDVKVKLDPQHNNAMNTSEAWFGNPDTNQSNDSSGTENEADHITIGKQQRVVCDPHYLPSDCMLCPQTNSLFSLPCDNPNSNAEDTEMAQNLEINDADRLIALEGDPQNKCMLPLQTSVIEEFLGHNEIHMFTASPISESTHSAFPARVKEEVTEDNANISLSEPNIAPWLSALGNDPSAENFANPCSVSQVLPNVSDSKDMTDFTSQNLGGNGEVNCTYLCPSSVIGIVGNENDPVCYSYPFESDIADSQRAVRNACLKVGKESCLLQTNTPERSDQVCSSHVNYPDNVVASHLSIRSQHSPASYDGLEHACLKDTAGQGNQESDEILQRSTVSEVKAAILGQKRVQVHADNKAMNSSYLFSTIRVKNEPDIEAYADRFPQLNCAVNCQSSILSLSDNCLRSQTVGEHNQDSPQVQHPRSTLSAFPFIKRETVEKTLGFASENHGNYSGIYDSASHPPNSLIEPLVMESQTSKTSLILSNSMVKRETLDELSVDMLDHISLKERRRMLIGDSFPDPINSSGYLIGDCSHTLISPENSINTPSIESTTRRRKRKRTATDSVETALEEDAPELLQVLIDKGINLDEIKLYGSIIDDESALDIISTEDTFSDLENLITKLFTERCTSLLKLGSLRETKESKIAYCLACLVSLIEQVRYLKLRKDPVEWGWCRDLQSFIFVFEKHNRIVLERPEYGYATYFFELVESLPTDWQIKRLVMAMKLTNCSRLALIENKALVVGEDLSEGEARVLEEYGWKPNSGLGSMLNFCDRVVHDRRNEANSSEWRSKIGKLLMKGYDGGRIVLSNVPKRVVEYMHTDAIISEPPAIKLEL